MEPAIVKTKKLYGYSNANTNKEARTVDGYYHGKLGLVRITSWVDTKGKEMSFIYTIVNGYEYSRDYTKAFTLRGLEMKAAQLLKDIYKEL